MVSQDLPLFFLCRPVSEEVTDLYETHKGIGR